MSLLSLTIFEDRGCKDFGPLTQMRPVWHLRAGGLTLGERIRLVSGITKISYLMRKDLAVVFQPDQQPAENRSPDQESSLYINSRLKLDDSFFSKIIKEPEEHAWYAGSDLIAVKTSDPRKVEISYNHDGIPVVEPSDDITKTEISAEIARYPWTLVNGVSDQIASDLKLYLQTRTVQNLKPPDFVITRDDSGILAEGEVTFSPGNIIDSSLNRVLLGNGVKLGAGAILDASPGPIWIDDGAEIQTGAIVTGAAYIGPNSIIRPGARISGGVSFGPHCRAGGEISSSIMQGFSSKQHSGYLGNSFIGEWVNLGAATDNSDLKNNYQPVDVIMNSRIIQTESLHVGAIIGDFTRTAIHTRLNTGTIIGTCCNIFSADFPARDIPPFTWVSPDGNFEYRFDKAIKTIRAVMPRRGKELTPQMEKLLYRIFSESRKPQDE